MSVITRFFSVILSVIITFLSVLGINTDRLIPKQTDRLNVIFMIGDGMGYNHLEIGDTENIKGIYTNGYSVTSNVNGETTDSAAGATALACGIKTANGIVGMKKDKLSKVQSLTEYAHENGMNTGIITTDYSYGATPAGFSAHTASRNNYDNIVSEQQSGIIDLLWCAVSDTYWSKSEAEALDYTYVTDRESMNKIKNGERTIGEFKQSTMYKGIKSSAYDLNPSLSDLTEKALSVLDNNEKGFFIMIEGAHIDKNSHENNLKQTRYAVEEFDRAVGKALDFAEKDGNTIVVVTADHETGGLTLGKDGSYYYTSTGHTNSNVPIYVYGTDDIITEGATINNTQISNRVKALLEEGVK